MAQPELDPLNHEIGNSEEHWDEGDYDSDDYDDDEGDDDIDAEAEEIARRLGEELWADLSKAAVDHAPTHDTGSSDIVAPIHPQPAPLAEHPRTTSQKGQAAIITIEAILAVVENDPPARLALASAVLPDSGGANVLDVLKQLAESGSVSKAIAMSLGPVLVGLARCDTLFGNLRHSNAPSIQLDKGKRKREETDSHDPRAFKRPYLLESDLQIQVNEAVRIITQALQSSPTRPLDPTLVSSIRLPLHQVFLFAVTSSARGSQDTHALQEISGLIQVIGVLSGIQIGQSPEHQTQVAQFPPNPAFPWLVPPPPLPPAQSVTDIGTAVYPCLIAGCSKTFSRLYSLRAHQRVHAVHRPYRCSLCPASFARNHDLKRHIKLHDRKAWKCGGCDKIFSRRDAIKRHKTGSKTRGPRSEACLVAEVLEVELDEDEGEDSMREERRAKLWSGIATSQADATIIAQMQAQKPHNHYKPPHTEEGEVQPATISAVQQTVLSLHGLLQAHVGGALGTPPGPSLSPPMDPAAGQATLASVIARAQLQNMPPRTTTTDDVDASNGLGGTSESSIDISTPNAAGPDTTRENESEVPSNPISTFTMYGLTDEQTKLLEEAITNAASAAQAQAEAEAALEEEDDNSEEFDDDSEGQPDDQQP